MRLRHFLIPCLFSLATVLTCSAHSNHSKIDDKSEIAISKAIKPHVSLMKQRLIAQGKTPKISMDSSGNAVAVWIYNHSLFAAVRQANQSDWSKPVVIVHSPINLKNLNLVGHANGQFAVIWIEQGVKGVSTVFLTTLSDVQSDWTAPVALSEECLQATNPALAINSSGEMVAAWEEHPGAITVVKYSRYSKKSGWSSPSQVSSTDRHAIFPSVAIDEQGNGMVMWVRKSLGTKPALETAMLPGDGSWVAPVDLDLTN